MVYREKKVGDPQEAAGRSGEPSPEPKPRAPLPSAWQPAEAGEASQPFRHAAVTK